MSKETREHLSALVDGEISRETSRFLVRRLGTDSELRATWTRYHLVRDCLRHQDGTLAGDDLCARVGQALENDQPVSAPHRIPTGWLKPVAGMAVAASVALMAIVAVGPNLTGAPQSGSEVAAESPAQPFTSPQGFAPGPSSSQASFSNLPDRRDQKMNSYLVRHYQATGTANGKGFVSFVPIVVTSSRETVEESRNGETETAENAKDQDSSR